MSESNIDRPKRISTIITRIAQYDEWIAFGLVLTLVPALVVFMIYI